MSGGPRSPEVGMGIKSKPYGISGPLGKVKRGARGELVFLHLAIMWHL